MFKSATLRLTIIYSLLFLSIIIAFSFGIYIWMNRSLGEGYISKVTSREVEGWGDLPVDFDAKNVITVAGDVTKAQLKTILISLNGVLLIIVPAIAYFIAGKTLKPIEESYSRQKRFVSDASHELRTPLTIMHGELDLALKKARTSEQYKHAIETAKSEVLRLEDLTENLLKIAKAEQSSQKFTTERIDAVDMVTEVVTSYESSSKSKNLRVDFTPPIEPIYFQGEESAIRQLVYNLYGNAVKFTPVNGSIKVSLENIGKYTQFKIIDSGTGMTEKEIKKALEPFYQGDSSRGEQGFGLGLTICKAIVKRHKGTLLLTSNKLNGLRVTVQLPN